jgi:hypothetical protein
VLEPALNQVFRGQVRDFLIVGFDPRHGGKHPAGADVIVGTLHSAMTFATAGVSIRAMMPSPFQLANHAGIGGLAFSCQQSAVPRPEVADVVADPLNQSAGIGAGHIHVIAILRWSNG